MSKNGLKEFSIKIFPYSYLICKHTIKFYKIIKMIKLFLRKYTIYTLTGQQFMSVRKGHKRISQ